MPRHKKLRLADSSPNIKVAIYVRVSTHYQIDRESLPFQRQDLINYTKYVLNTENYAVFEDAGYSAKNTDRPKYQEMMSRIRQDEFTHLLVWKLDRISRNLRDFTELWDELKEYSVRFISKMEQFDTSTAMGEAMLRIILVFAELERKLTAERVYSTMLSRAEKALWNGQPAALGYDWDPENKTVVINSKEAALVQEIYDKYEEVGSALTTAQWLCENNRATKRGGKWGSKGVIDILRNPSYIGIYRWNYRESARGKLKPEDEVVTVENALPAIISQEQWERVQKLLDTNYKGRRNQQRRAKNIHLLSCLIRCGYCGKNYIASLNTRPHKNGYHPSFYRCGTYVRNRQCRNKSLSGLYIEPFVLEYIVSFVQASRGPEACFQENLLKAFNRPEIEYIDIQEPDLALDGVLGGIEETAAAADNQQKVVDNKAKSLKKKKQKIERAIARLDDAYYFAEEHAAISKTEYLIKRSEFQQRLAKIDNRLSSLPESPDNIALDIDTISRFLFLHNLYNTGNIREILPTLDKRAVQEFLQQVIKYIEVIEGRVIKIVFNSNGAEAPHRFIYKDEI